MEYKALCIFQMIEQSTGRGDKKIDTFFQLMGLLASLGASNNDSMGLSMVL